MCVCVCVFLVGVEGVCCFCALFVTSLFSVNNNLDQNNNSFARHNYSQSVYVCAYTGRRREGCSSLLLVIFQNVHFQSYEFYASVIPVNEFAPEFVSLPDGGFNISEVCMVAFSLHARIL